MSLTETLRALCVKHQIDAVSLHAGVGHSRDRAYVNAHWGDGNCTCKWGDTLEEALANTIAAVNALRVVAVDVPALELGEAA